MKTKGPPRRKCQVIIYFPRLRRDFLFYMTETTKISTGKQKKIDSVTELKTKIDKSKSLFLADYKGLTHQQMEQLKKALKKVEAEFVVTKNTLLKIALKESLKLKDQKDAISEFEKNLVNSTASLFTYGDEIAAIKEMAKFIKTRELPKIKMGLFSDKIASDKDFTQLANLPAREVLLSMLVSRLQSPISELHYALNWNLQRFVTVLGNIKDKKPKN